MTARLSAASGLFVLAVLAAGCQNAAPHFGQSAMGSGLFGPHVAGSQPPHNGDPFQNAEYAQGGTATSGRVHVAGMQQPAYGQATSNVSPTIIPAGYQQPSMPAGYQQSTMPAGYQPPAMPAGYQPPAGPFSSDGQATPGAAGWHSSQAPVYVQPN